MKLDATFVVLRVHAENATIEAYMIVAKARVHISGVERIRRG
jgi:hypothetical protein